MPPIVTEELFAAVQEQLEENRRRSREQLQNKARHLLQGLVVCGRCGSACCGRFYAQKAKRYGHYRCLGTDGPAAGGRRVERRSRRGRGS